MQNRERSDRLFRLQIVDFGKQIHERSAIPNPKIRIRREEVAAVSVLNSSTHSAPLNGFCTFNSCGLYLTPLNLKPETRNVFFLRCKLTYVFLFGLRPS